VFFDIGP